MKSSDCILTCMTKMDLATKFCEHVTRNHPINKQVKQRFLDYFKEDKKVEELINKLY